MLCSILGNSATSTSYVNFRRAGGNFAYRVIEENHPNAPLPAAPVDVPIQQVPESLQVPATQQPLQDIIPVQLPNQIQAPANRTSAPPAASLRPRRLDGATALGRVARRKARCASISRRRVPGS